ncbi:MAG: hypothetical protein E7527_05815 [Ruminococcaceae bacterium]|nr:hypothetical protein [Oscillospiraceae bacterium]
MDQDKLWHNFVHSGKVEDYLRYRGIDPVAQSMNYVNKEESGYGNRPKTASDDRRPDSQGV